MNARPPSSKLSTINPSSSSYQTTNPSHYQPTSTSQYHLINSSTHKPTEHPISKNQAVHAYTMKSSVLFTAASLLGISTSLPTTHREITARQDQAWAFNVYQGNARCTGARDPYSGTGSQECTTGIRNGSFGSFIRGDISEDCVLYLYNNDDCDMAGLMDILTADDEQTCLQPELEVSNSASFKAVCA